MKQQLSVVLTVATLVAPSSGCNELECAEGTHEEGGVCVSSLTPQCGPGTALESGFCRPIEGGASCGAGTHEEGASCVPDLTASANASRIVNVTLQKPSILAAVANQPLNNALSSGDSLVFVAIYEPTDAILHLYGGGGVRNADASYTLDRAQGYAAPATRAAGLAETEPFVMLFPVLGDTPLTLERTVLSNVMTQVVDGLEVAISGDLEGIITVENAKKIYIELGGAFLDTLLVQIGAEFDADYDGDGTLDSWTLALSFATEPVWLF
jgi:hypothetical protein